MIVVFEQVLVLFLFAAAGFVLTRSGVVNGEHGGLLSKLLVYVFLPCNVFKTFSARFTVEYLRVHGMEMLLSLAVLVAVAVAAHFVGRLLGRERYEGQVYEYSLVVPNAGYMGYALAESLLGSTALLNMMLFNLPVSVYTYTIGFCMLTKRKLTFRKLCNPVIIAMLLGTAAGLLSLPLPAVLTEALGTAAGCMAPAAMLLTGIVVAGYQFAALLTNWRVYVVTAIRLFVLPLAVGGALWYLVSPAVAQTAVLIYAMPCGLNSVVFPKSVGENCTYGASLALLSSVCACVSIPLVFALFGIG
ncbi:MAG: hypothetical protein E7549_01525 [Ruminococcaceae bacterium]|nr:hypothetical protein [Oscillospiraceae bacterium]